MKLEASIIPFGILYKVVPGLVPYLEKSEMWTRGRAKIDDIIAFLYSKQMLLWSAYDPKDLKSYGFVITEIRQYPNCKMLVLQYCAGEPNHMEYVDDAMNSALEKFAKVNDCAGIEAFARTGWRRAAKERGYTSQSVMYEKFL
jgi:hypothetical protein